MTRPALRARSLDPERVRALLDDLGALIVLLIGLAAVCWPALQDGRRGLMQYDTSFTQIATEHLQDVALHGASWRDAPLAWPLAFGTAAADWQAGQAVLGLPLRLLDLDPSRAALLLALLGLAATGFAGHRLARALLGRGPHTWLAAALTGPGAMALAHVQHVNLIHHEATLAGALLLGAGLTGRRPWLAGLGAAALALAFHLGVYMGVHAALVGAVVLVGAALARQGDRRSWRAAGLGLAAAGLTVWPVLTMYSEADDWHDTSISAEESLSGSWDPATFAAPIARAWLHPQSADAPQFPGGPGYLATALALVGLLGLRARTPRWAWGATLTVLALSLGLALGPELQWRGGRTGIPGPYALLSTLPGLEDLRQPHRWLLVAFPAMGLFAAAGLRDLLGRLPGLARLPAGLLAVGVAFGEVPRVRTASLDQLGMPGVYSALAQVQAEGAYWESASPPGRRACACSDESMMRAALLLRRPVAALQTARTLARLVELRKEVGRWPSTQASELLGQIGVVAVVEHPPLARAAVQGWSCQLVGNHRLCVATRPGSGVGVGAPPLYTGLAVDAPWIPPLPARDRVFDRFAGWLRP